MNLFRTSKGILLVTLFVALMGSGQVLAQTSAAQPSNQADRKDDETNLDIQLYLLTGTNQDVDDAKIPASLDSVVRQLHAWLPFKNYRLNSTLVNRVRNEGHFSVLWPMMAAGASGGTLTPSFNEFRVNGVKLVRDAAGQQLVRIDGFRFGARIPVQTGIQGTPGTFNAQSVPTINYENTGLNTDLSIKEGDVVIVGTLNVGSSGDAIIVIMSARRTSK